VHDHARPRPVGLDADRAGEHRAGGEALAQHGDVVEAVEQRQHHRRLRRDARQRRLQPGGLRGHDQRVHRLGQPRHRARVRDELAEQHAAHVHAVRSDHLGGRLARDHHHLRARPLERARQQAAHTTGT
jgi:hypothetical protein